MSCCVLTMLFMPNGDQDACRRSRCGREIPAILLPSREPWVQCVVLRFCRMSGRTDEQIGKLNAVLLA